MAETLSQLLADYISERDQADDDPADEEVRQFTKLLATALLVSRLAPTVHNAIRTAETLVREHQGMIEDLLDEHYSRDLVKKIPKLVRRTLRLSSLIVKDTPSTAVNVYISEATRNYVFGFWPSCIALSRV